MPRGRSAARSAGGRTRTAAPGPDPLPGATSRDSPRRTRQIRRTSGGVDVPGRGPSLRARPLARSWERIARIRALGSQPPPPPPGWRGAPEKPYPRLVILRQPVRVRGEHGLTGISARGPWPHRSQLERTALTSSHQPRAARRRARRFEHCAPGQAGPTGKPIGDTLDRTKDRSGGCQRPIRRPKGLGQAHGSASSGTAWNGSLWALSESAWGDPPAASRR